PQAGAAQHQDRPVDRQRGANLGDAALGQPGVLLAEQRIEALGEFLVANLSGPVALELAVERPGQPRQDDFHQLLTHEKAFLQSAWPAVACVADERKGQPVKTQQAFYAGHGPRAKCENFPARPPLWTPREFLRPPLPLYTTAPAKTSAAAGIFPPRT